MTAADTTLALDVSGLNDLKRMGRENSPEALRRAAQQFETVFVNMLMKSMRATLKDDGPLSSEHTRMFHEMLDQQFAQQMSHRSTLGLARLLEAQLTARASSGHDATANAANVSANHSESRTGDD